MFVDPTNPPRRELTHKGQRLAKADSLGGGLSSYRVDLRASGSRPVRHSKRALAYSLMLSESPIDSLYPLSCPLGFAHPKSRPV